MRYAIHLFLMLVMLDVTGCNLLPWKIRVSNPPAFPMVQTAGSFDRTAYRFISISTNGNVFLQNRPTKDYDAGLYDYSTPSCPVAFRKASSGYKWNDEQGIFTGLNLYASVDSIFPEEIVLNHD